MKLKSPKQKGSAFERELVNKLKEQGLHAVRAWGSNGAALGLHEEVDVVLDYVNKTTEQDAILKIQCKRKKRMPDYLGLSSNVDASVFREDRGEAFILLRFDDFIREFVK